MNKEYILSVDQSTQGTKCLLFNANGDLLHREDLPHKQIINEKGWVSHNPEEIYQNLLKIVQKIINIFDITSNQIACLGISNQRETSLAWNKNTGEPVGNAIVWQCARASDLCERIAATGYGNTIFQRTGIPISPYFPASKFAWILENIPGARELANAHQLCFGTIDTWLVYRLTKGQSYKTDYSNASRTQLFDIVNLCWNPEICHLFGIDPSDLAEVCDSDSLFGYTDFDGILDKKIPITGVIGDSQGALFGHGALKQGMLKATYGTGSSVVLNTGLNPIFSKHGLITSIAWGRQNQIQYIMEGNINYSGASITWLKEIGLISSALETEALAKESNPDDTTYLVPAFTGLGAPYWNSHVSASFSGMTRLTRRPELVRATLDAIAYQIKDILESMKKDSGITINELLVDGGASRNHYLMQFQSDIMNATVKVPDAEELSGIGAAYMAGISCGLLDKSVFENRDSCTYYPNMDEKERNKKYCGWQNAVQTILTSN